MCCLIFASVGSLSQSLPAGPLPVGFDQLSEMQRRLEQEQQLREAEQQLQEVELQRERAELQQEQAQDLRDYLSRPRDEEPPVEVYIP